MLNQQAKDWLERPDTSTRLNELLTIIRNARKEQINELEGWGYDLGREEFVSLRVCNDEHVIRLTSLETMLLATMRDLKNGQWILIDAPSKGPFYGQLIYNALNMRYAPRASLPGDEKDIDESFEPSRGEPSVNLFGVFVLMIIVFLILIIYFTK